MNKNKVLLVSFILLFINAATGLAQNSDISENDPRAVAMVDEMWQALGGKSTWEQNRYLSFHWVIEREGEILADYRHDWDRHTARYRLEGVTSEKQHLVAIFDTETRQGEVYLDGARVQENSTRQKMLEFAYGRHINDSYWFIMPYKLNDPGVILHYEGEKEVEGDRYDVVKVTFDNVGLTPGDTYWAFISKDDRLMHRWEYLLQNREPPPSSSWWKDWQEFSGNKLALDREFEGRPVRIYFRGVVLSPQVDETIFEQSGKTF